MTNSPVKYKFLFSVSGMNKCPASFMTVYTLSLVQTYWAAEETLLFSTLSYSLAVQQVSLHLLANFLKNVKQKALVVAACFHHKWVFKTHVNVCTSQILRKGMCSLKIVHVKELPVHKVSHPVPKMRNIQKAQEWRRQSQMPCTDIRLQESFWLFRFIVDRK